MFGGASRVVWGAGLALGGLLAVTACAAPAPTATPTPRPPAGAATPTKAPTATPTKRPLTKVEVAQASLSFSYVPAYVAKEKGYFLEESLDVSWVLSGGGAKSVAAVVGRSTPIGHAGAPDVATAIAQGQPLRLFAHLSIGIPYWIVVRKEIAEQRGITSKMTLGEKGKAIKGLTFAATSPGGSSDYTTRYFLRGAGLDPDRDVNIAYISADSILPAFEQGAIDAMSQTVARIVPPLQEGKAVMLVDFAKDVPATANSYYMVALTHRDELEGQPELLEAYVRGLWRGLRLIGERETEARDLVRKAYFSDMDPALYQITWELNLPSLPKEPTLTAERFKATLDFRNATEPPPPLDIKFEECCTNKLVETAKRQLGL